VTDADAKPTPAQRPAGQRWWPLAAVALPLLVYVALLTPTVLDGDAATFARQAHVLGLAHAPGYPLVGMVGRAVTAVVPFGDPGWQANLVGALAAAASLALAYALARRWGAGPVAATMAAWVLAFSPLFWSQARFVNPYMLGVAFALGVFLLLDVWAERRGLWLLAAAAALYGFGMGGHPSLALFLPGVAAFVLVKLWRDGWRRIALSALVGAGAAVVGCLPWLGYTVLYLSREPIPQGRTFVEHLVVFLQAGDSPSDWRTFVFGVFSKAYVKAVLGHGLLTLSQVSLAGVVLAAVGAVSLARRRWPALLLVGLGYLAQMNFACTLEHWHTFDVYRLPTYALLTLLAAVGLGAMARRVRRYEPRLGLCLAAVVLCLGPPYATLWAVPSGSGSGVLARLRPQMPFRRAFARENRADCATALEQAGDGSALVTTWGPYATCRFLQDVEGVGRGVRLVTDDESAEELQRLLAAPAPRPQVTVLVRGKGASEDLRRWVDPQPMFVGARHVLYRAAPGRETRADARRNSVGEQ